MKPSKDLDEQKLDEILEDFYDGDIRQSDMGKAKQQLLALIEQREREVRFNEVQNAYEHWINGRKFISSYFRERIENLQKGKL